MDQSEVKHLPKVDHTPAELDEASKLLLKAAALIEQYGWCQGRAYENTVLGTDSAMCMFGAIYGVEGFQHPARADAENRVNGACGKFMGVWNDVPGRTKDEVVAKLRAVALGL